MTGVRRGATSLKGYMCVRRLIRTQGHTMPIKGVSNGRIRGSIVAKKCECCGHHEIGIEKEDGTYIQLKPGMKIMGYLVPTETKDYYVDCSKKKQSGEM